MADEDLTQELLQLVEQAATLQQLRKGANEATKTLNRSKSELIILAADATPLEIILHLPLLCEDKGIMYIFVPSKAELGQACGTTRNVVACSILKEEHSKLNKDINAIQIKVEKCFLQNQAE